MAKDETAATSYFDTVAGDGLENFTPDTLGVAYLGLIQPDTETSIRHQAGQWRNSATDEVYGDTIEVIPIAFQTVWVERSKDPPYNTVGRYLPHSIDVSIDYPKLGARGFPKMINPVSGNRVEELYSYGVMIKNMPDKGVMLFSPTSLNMQTCKSWNRLMSTSRLKSGKIAPMYAFSWILTAGLVPNPKKPASQVAKFISCSRGEQLTDEFFLENVKGPATLAKPTFMLLAAPEIEE